MGEYLQNSFSNFCDHVTTDSDSKRECKEMIGNNFEKVVHLLFTKQDAKTVCFRPCGFVMKSPAKLESKNIAVTKPKESEICSICEIVIQDFADVARSPSVKNGVQTDLEKLCNKTGNLAKLCNLLVVNYFPMIYDEIITSVKPESVCSMIRLCTLNEEESLANQDQLCKICQLRKTFDKNVEEKLASNLRAVVDKKLQSLCTPEFDLFDCNPFIKEAAPIVYNFLRVGDPNTFCSHMEHCPALNVPPPTYGDNMTCEFCEDLVMYVKNIVESKSTEEEFRTAFTNMCKDLKELSSECTTLVNEYFDQFYDFLIKNLDPQAVCTTLGLCDNSMVRQRIMMQLSPVKFAPQPKVSILLTKSEQRQKMLESNRPVEVEMVRLIPASQTKMIKLQKAQKVSGIEVEASPNTKELHRVPLTKIVESNRIDFDARPVPGVNSIVNNDIECSLCKASIMFLEKQLESNRSEERIRKALDSVCTLFPGELSDQCQDFINEYTEMFVTLIIQEANPNVVCAVVKVCTVEDAILPSDFNEEYKKTHNVKFIQCELCKRVMQYVENYLGNNKTEAQIKSALEKVCSELPAKYADECTAFVEEYADIIITLLTKEVAPTMVCAALGLCPGEKSPGGNEVECTVCQYVLHFLQNQLMLNSTEDDIKAAVEQVCAKLPKPLDDNCDAFIEQYGDSLIVLLVQKLDPSIICVTLKLCSSSQNQPAVVPKINLPKLGKCDTCEMVVNYMDKILENDDVDSEVTKLVEKICTILPLAVRDECSTIIDLYGPYILQMIGQVSDSKAVCQAIDLCSRAEKTKLLGAEKCTYGPSYWCQSVRHATACSAHDYCKQKVWKM